MAATSTIDSQGQLTIPEEIREAFDLREGDQVEFVRDGDKLHLVPYRGAEKNPFLKFVGIAPSGSIPEGSVAWVREMRGYDPDGSDFD